MKTKVLVVDNNPVLLRAVSAILIQEGCITRTAGTGLEALEIADDFCPEIVFTDLIMPMVNGEQLCRILRNLKKHKHVFLVVLSAILLEDRERILKEIQCDLCIAKGNLQEIRRHVQEVLQVFNERNRQKSGRGIVDARIPDGLKPSETTSELLWEKQHYNTILTNLEEGIIELNHQGKVVSVNISALTILSCREEFLVGQYLPRVVDWGAFNDAVSQWTEQQLIAEGMNKFEILEDTPLFFDDRVIIASFVPFSQGGSTFGLCILRDISRQYNAEKHQKEVDNALRLVKKMDAMSCMAGGFSHDFNNLLTVICGNLDIVTMHGDSQSSTERRKLLEQVKKAALVAVDLTRQISCFSNFGIISRENVDVVDLVRDTVDRFFKGKENCYKLRATCKNNNVHADPEEISLAIDNVLQNAVEACPDQKIEISIVESEFHDPQLMSGQYVPAGKYLRTDIRDKGKGINSERLFRIFDPYYSTKERGSVKGMGLGLTVVYAILRNHGGYVVVDSKPDQGTIVSMYLPALEAGQTVSVSDDGLIKEKRSVLFVEPERQMGEIGKIMLGYLGFSVISAIDRSSAISALQKCLSDSQLSKPLVILALSTTSTESAVETCRLIHEIDPELKVIAMSGTILDPIMVNYREYGFINTIPKPFSMDSLKHILTTALQS